MVGWVGNHPTIFVTSDGRLRHSVRASRAATAVPSHRCRSSRPALWYYTGIRRNHAGEL